MERGVVVRGRLHGRRIELDEPVGLLDGEVEVTVRPVAQSHPTVADMLALVATFPPGDRTKDDIDRQIAEERASWDRDRGLPRRLLLPLAERRSPRGARPATLSA